MSEEELIKNKLIEINKKLDNIYCRANTKSKMKKVVNDLSMFSSMCDYRFGGLLSDFSWQKDENYYYYLYNCSNNKAFYENIFLNKDLYNSISKNVINSFINSNFSLYKDYYKFFYCRFPRLTDREITSSLKDFMSDYDENWLNDIIGMSSEGLMYDGEFYDSGGCVYPISSLEKNFLFVSTGYGNNVFSNSFRTHEYGHVYEFLLHYRSKMCDNTFSILNTPFYEVASSFFEYAYLMYLKNNNLYVDSTDSCLRYFYNKVFSFNYEMNLITMLSDIVISDGEVTISSNFKDYVDYIKNSVNFYSLPKEGDNIMVTHSFIYGLGETMAISLYEEYLKDKEKFKKNFKNALFNYSALNDIYAFSETMDVDSFVNGDTLKKVLSKYNDF